VVSDGLAMVLLVSAMNSIVFAIIYCLKIRCESDSDFSIILLELHCSDLRYLEPAKVYDEPANHLSKSSTSILLAPQMKVIALCLFMSEIFSHLAAAGDTLDLLCSIQSH